MTGWKEVIDFLETKHLSDFQKKCNKFSDLEKKN